MALIHEQLSKVMQSVSHVAKLDRNEQQRFLFRGVDAVVNAVGPAFREHGIVVAPDVQRYEYGTVEVGKNRTPMAHVIVEMTYRLAAADGSYIEASSLGEAMDSGDKAMSKAMSVAYRIALLQALCLPTDEPKDPDHDVYERAAISAQISQSVTQAAPEAVQEHPAPEHPAATSDFDSFEKARNDVLAWGQANSVPPDKLAQRYTSEFGGDIRQAGVDDLRKFYALLETGGTVVSNG